MVALSELYMVKQHLISFFKDHEFEELVFENGPMVEAAPWFRVLRFRPGPRLNLWAYVSLGASTLRDDEGGLEFSIFSEYESPRFVELLTMSAYYHRDYKLGVEHTAALGEHWVEGSKCNCYLVSLPYPLGPDFEICATKENHVHVLWLLPITEQERDYKVKNGAEALECLFDSTALKYWDFGRKSVV
jgi:hypothetical protein